MRRLAGAATALATAAITLFPVGAGAEAPDTERVPTKTPIKHFITLMQENHSFDNYFGTYPGADGIPKDVCMPVDPQDPGAAPCVRPYHLENVATEDLAHSRAVHDAQYNGGRMDGFIGAFETEGGRPNTLSMGYYDDRDLPYYWNVADNYVLFDRFFTSARGGSVANHMYWVAGHPGNSEVDRIPREGFSVPTIFDRLEERGISWKFYVQNYDPTITIRNQGEGDRASQVVWVPLLNFPRYLDNPRLFGKIVDLDEFSRDLERGTLPAVAFVVPSGASEHPPGSVRAGQSFVRTLINSLERSDAWRSSAFMWTYDDWGGWYDHVAPPQVDRFGYGFRAPALLVSPYARKGHVDHTQLDFTSMLRFMEENWGLAPLAERDARANNFFDAFEFDREPRPPVFLSASRREAAPVSPRRGIIYAAYGAALGLWGIVVAVAARQDRRDRRGGRRLARGAAG